MKKRICIIDDSLPAGDYPTFIDEKALLDQAVLKYLCMEHDTWPEDQLKELIKVIFEKHKDWKVSGFLNPDFYFNHVEEEVYSPEVIIFDWDYVGASQSTQNHLWEILQSTYSVVGIYTGADKKDEIQAILEQEKFQSFSENRIRLVEKGETGSVSKIIREVDERFTSHFSFRLGQELKYNAIKALDSILVKVGEMSFDEFVWTFGHGEATDSNHRYITINEFIEILSEKFRNNLGELKWTEEEFKCSEPIDSTPELVRRLWSYRLFRSPKDDIVRVGDIISREGCDHKKKFLVVSSDCHLNQFWKKNFGSLTLIPLFANLKDNEILQKPLLRSRKRRSIRETKATSISNLRGLDSLTLISSLPVNISGKIEFIDYVAFPRSVFSVSVPPPEMEDSQLRNQGLLYSHMDKYSGDDRWTINEPFRSPLIQFCINSITGYGAPDYPGELQKSIQTRFDENFTA